MKRLLAVIFLALSVPRSFATECGKVALVVEGPMNKDYRVLTSFSCENRHFTGSTESVFEDVKANLLRRMAIVGRSRIADNPSQTVLEFSGKVKPSVSCSLAGQSPDGIFDVVLRLKKDSSQIILSRTSSGPMRSAGGVVKRMEMKSLIDVTDNALRRRESIDGVVGVTGVAANFPNTVKGKLRDRFTDFANCFKHELEAAESGGAQR